MAEVKWIKIVTDIFDDEKIRYIETMPGGDAIIVIWFKLLCLAGKCNAGGLLMLANKIAYTEEMLASIFVRDIKVIQLALRTFENLNMVEIVDNVYYIANWEKHQNAEKLEAVREYDRERKRLQRAKKRLLAQEISRPLDTSLSRNCPGQEAGQETESPSTDISISISSSFSIEEDKGDCKGEKKQTPYKEIVDLYSEICKSYPAITTLSNARKKAIKARFTSGYTLDDFKRLFEMAEASDFLKGKNNRNWRATFDWLIADANMAKVLDGNYSNRDAPAAKSNNPFYELYKEMEDGHQGDP